MLLSYKPNDVIHQTSTICNPHAEVRMFTLIENPRYSRKANRWEMMHLLLSTGQYHIKPCQFSISFVLLLGYKLNKEGSCCTQLHKSPPHPSEVHTRNRTLQVQEIKGLHQLPLSLHEKLYTLRVINA